MQVYSILNKSLKEMHDTYQLALKQGSNLGNRKIISAWKNQHGEVTSGQFFNRKVLPNGNTKTRILTIYDNQGNGMGLETMVQDIRGNLIYRSAGIVKDNTSKLQNKLRILRKKIRTGFATKKDIAYYKKNGKNLYLNTKMYECNENLVDARFALYNSYPGSKRLFGSNYVLYRQA